MDVTGEKADWGLRGEWASSEQWSVRAQKGLMNSFEGSVKLKGSLLEYISLIFCKWMNHCNVSLCRHCESAEHRANLKHSHNNAIRKDH